MKAAKTIFLLTSVIILASILQAKQKPIIAIQPFETIKDEIIKKVVKGIQDVYDIDIIVLTAKKLPKAAYYKPNNRYRAEILLDYLDKKIDGKYTKVLGLTKRDISTTKGKYYDWGIFGFGSLGGRPCVISTYRLKRGNVSKNFFIGRLIKVTNHELGHTFGINHCPTKGCLMQDAQGTIKTVDSETGKFCKKCINKIRHLLK